jgi:MerR family mercuric resistance operon transcriptional regulator
VETIRFYQLKGLLPQPKRPYGSIRRYGQADVARVKFVKSAQRLGFSLDEVGQLLKLEDGTHCSEAAEPVLGWPMCAHAWRTSRGWKTRCRSW